MDCKEMRKELNDYYFHHADQRAHAFYEACIAELDAAYVEGMTPFAMKRLQYETISERMDPILFHTCPFYYETGTLSAQCDGARDYRGH